MAFSQTLDLGNNTLDELEKNALEIINTENISDKALDVIDESPNNSRPTKKNASRAGRLRAKITHTQSKTRKVLRKSKSDSLLRTNSANENYSQFFKSDFNCSGKKDLKSIPAKENSRSSIYFKKNSFENLLLDDDGFSQCLLFSDCKETKTVSIHGRKRECNSKNSEENEVWGISSQFNDVEVSKKNQIEENLVDSFINIEDTSFLCMFHGDKSLEENSFLDQDLEISRKEVRRALKDEFETEDGVLNVSSSRNLSKRNLSSELCNITTSNKIVLNWSISSEESAIPNVQHNFPDAKETEKLKYISSWGLPSSIVKQYKKKGITSMFDWQVECLSNRKVLFDFKNLVYSAPTSAGKTLISEILVIKTVLERRKKAMIILPFISVVREKMGYFQDLLAHSGCRVEGFFGGYSPPGGFDSINVAICTIEKANSIMNKMLELEKLDTVGLVVIDEVHLISDPGRGYILELLLAKLLYVKQKYDMKIQIVTMSATLSNAKILQKWLDAELYTTTFRPVELHEMIKVGPKIYDSNMKMIRQLDLNRYNIANDQDSVAYLCIETILEGCSVIVFCPSKDWCETLCVHVATSIYNLGREDSDNGQKMRQLIQKHDLDNIKSELKNSPIGLDSVLAKTISVACAFHHAGLTMDERDIIETNFKAGVLKVIIATSTLSSGVNLPARRVIIRTPLFGGKPMNCLTYKQMIGRAGRTGKDTLGESILICDEKTKGIGNILITADLKPIVSCLDSDSSIHLKRALLEVISSGVAKTLQDLENFIQCTLLSVEQDLNQSVSTTSTEKPINDCLQFLIEYEFIRLQCDDESNEANYIPTRLGMACLASSMSPTDGLILFSELQKSRKCFVLESELHAVYLVTPYSVCYQLAELDWLDYLDMWEKLSPAMKRVGELVGVKESFLVRAMRGQSKMDPKLLQIHKRFYTALALQELVNEAPINAVSTKFKCSRGLLQSLQQMSATFAGIVTAFCNSLNWTMLGLLVSQFKERLFFGVHRDLIDLMRIPDLSSHRARALFNSGIQNLIDLANADVFTIEKILHNCISFDTARKTGDENEDDLYRRNNLRNLYVTGKVGITVAEAAKMLVSEARTFLQYEMGAKNVKWTQEPSGSASICNSNQDDCDERLRNNNEAASKRLEEKDSQTLKLDNSKESFKNEVSKEKRIKSCDKSEECISPLQQLNKNIDLSDKSNRKRKSERLNNVSSRGNPKYTKSKRDKPNISELLISDASLEDICDKSIKIHKGSERNNIDNLILSSVQNQRVLRSGKTLKYVNNSQIKHKKENISNNDLSVGDISDLPAMKSVISSPWQLNASHILSSTKIETNSGSFDCLHIIDICGNLNLFKKASSEITKSKCIGISVAVEKISSSKKPIIGANLLEDDQITDNNKYDFVFDEGFYIAGVSLTAEKNFAFYMNFQQHNSSPEISKTMKLETLLSIFSDEKKTIRLHEAKEHLKVLRKVIPYFSNIDCTVEDPRVASWLLQPDNDMNIYEMAQQYAPECADLAKIVTKGRSNLSSGLNYSSSIRGRVRSAVESCVALHILPGQLENLERIGSGQLKKFFYELEMPLQISLYKMESVGFPTDHAALENLYQNMFEAMKKMASKIYELHGTKFNLESSSAVARVLGLHKKANGRYCTSKQILEKIDSPIADLILNYRKLSATLKNNIQPLLQCVVENRIHGTSLTFTSTGRISMREPNLQNVAKDFEVLLHEKTVISPRSAFYPRENKCLISADFCQLEMRILTHLSGDSALIAVMKSDKDVFTAIAANWNKVPEDEISDALRNGTKQICYGIIYGMGMKSLAESLKCTEQEAITISDQFHAAYPGIRSFTQKIIRDAQEKGYVETITGRLRYLPHINSTDIRLRGQAERQAVNSTIQGSAADISKSAIIRMEKNLLKYKNQLKINVLTDNTSQVDFVLHLHDELIFEVPKERSLKIAKALKITMENSVKLTVPLRVKLKIGKSWGTLQELKF